MFKISSISFFHQIKKKEAFRFWERPFGYFSAFRSKESKFLIFIISKHYFTYFNTSFYSYQIIKKKNSFYNILNIKVLFLAYNILKWYKQFLPTYTHQSHYTTTNSRTHDQTPKPTTTKQPHTPTKAIPQP